MAKTCKKCKETKLDIWFHKQSSQRDGLQIYCIECKKLISREYTVKRRQRNICVTDISCVDCHITKNVSQFNKNPLGRTGFERRCKMCQSVYLKHYNRVNVVRIKEIKRQSYQKNKPARRAWHKDYVTKNIIRIREWSNFRFKHRYQTEILFNLKARLRSRLVSSLKTKAWKKNTKFATYIGCSSHELIAHLEKGFQPGMNWDNRALWEIDHIIPLASAKTEAELYRLCHYTNLQPLWAKENRAKGHKYNHG